MTDRSPAAELEARYREVAVFAAVIQNRLADHLDHIGPPGRASWDPHGGQVELRGARFRAEQLGSFDGRSWLWSWANEFLDLPLSRTTMARGLRDSETLDMRAVRVPEIETSDEGMPYMIAALALSQGLGEGFYIANQSQVYLFDHGQVPDPGVPKLDELQRAVASIIDSGMPCDMERAVAFAARAMGLECQVGDDGTVVRDGGDERVFRSGGLGTPTRLATCFCAQRFSLAMLMEHVKHSSQLASFHIAQDGDEEFTVAGPGFEVRVTRLDRLRAVMREANALPARADDAKKYGAAVLVQTARSADYAGMLASASFGGWAPVGMGIPQMPGQPSVPLPALLVCERLNALDDALVFDHVLHSFYPRG